MIALLPYCFGAFKLLIYNTVKNARSTGLKININILLYLNFIESAGKTMIKILPLNKVILFFNLLFSFDLYASTTTSIGPMKDVGDGVMRDARISFSADSKRFLLSWKRESQWSNTLFEIEKGIVKNRVDIKISGGGKPSGISSDGNSIINIRKIEKKSFVYAFDINSKINKLSFSENSDLSFLSEVKPHVYVYLSNVNESSYSKWTLQENGEKKYLSDGLYRSATFPNFISKSYFLLVPDSAPHIVVLSGKFETVINGYVSNRTGALRCSDEGGVICLRAEHFVNLVSSHSEVSVMSKRYVCKLGDRWQDLRSMVISPNGKMAAFIAKYENIDKVFLVDLKIKCGI